MIQNLERQSFRILGRLFAGVLWGALFCVAACSKPEIDIEISQQAIQEKVSKKFPLQKNVMIAEFSLHSPQAYLAQEKVGLKLNFNAKLMRFTLDGGLDVTGRLRFDAGTGQFFVHQLEIVTLEVKEKSFSNIDQLKSIIMPSLNSHLKETPVYTLPTDTLKQRLKGRLLKRVAVRDGALVATFGP